MAQQQYTLMEVAGNNGEKDKPTWIIIHDVVYDVTDYLEHHPGGGELITDWAGRDATKGFDDFGHSTDAKKELRDYRIGTLVEEDRKGNRKKKQKDINDNSINKKKKSFSWKFC